MVKAFGYRSNGAADVQEFLDLVMPSPLAGELLVQVHAAGVNPVDWKIRSGAYGATPPDRLPTVFGFEASGVVRAVGQDVDGFAVGDEVFGSVAPGSGTWAEFTLLTADGTAHKPPHVSFNDAATLSIAGATGYDGVTQLALKPGDTLLINGSSGGVGVAAAQIARDLDIFVIGTASGPKQALVESLDATFVAYGDGVADRIRALMPDGHAIVREYGRGVLDVLAAMVADGKLDPHVEDAVPLEKAADALAAVEGGHAKGKLVIEVA